MTLLTAETFRRVHPGQQRLRLGRPGQNCHRNLFCCMSLHSGGTAYPNHRTLPWLRAGHCRRRQRQLGALNDGNVRGGLAIIRAMAIKDVIALLDSAKFSHIMGALFSRKRSVYAAIGFSREYPRGWANSENARKSERMIRRNHCPLRSRRCRPGGGCVRSLPPPPPVPSTARQSYRTSNALRQYMGIGLRKVAFGPEPESNRRTWHCPVHYSTQKLRL